MRNNKLHRISRMIIHTGNRMPRVPATFTVEAVFVVSIICIVTIILISRTLEFCTQTDIFTETCKNRAKEKTDVLTAMRLERLVGKIIND